MDQYTLILWLSSLYWCIFLKHILIPKKSAVMDTLFQTPEAKWWYGLTRKVEKYWFFSWGFDSKEMPNTTWYTSCKYVNDEIQQSNDIFDLPPDIEHTFYTPFFWQTSPCCGNYKREDKSNEITN